MINFVTKKQVIPFAGKRSALVWLREQGFIALRGTANSSTGGWTCGARQAVWLTLPGQKPAGVLVISGVCDHG